MAEHGPPGEKKRLFFENDLGPHGMPKQVFLLCFELMVARFAPPTIPKCLEDGLFWDQNWLKDGSKMGQKCVFPKTDPRPFGVHKQVG